MGRLIQLHTAPQRERARYQLIQALMSAPIEVIERVEPEITALLSVPVRPASGRR